MLLDIMQRLTASLSGWLAEVFLGMPTWREADQGHAGETFLLAGLEMPWGTPGWVVVVTEERAVRASLIRILPPATCILDYSHEPWDVKHFLLKQSFQMFGLISGVRLIFIALDQGAQSVINCRTMLKSVSRDVRVHGSGLRLLWPCFYPPLYSLALVLLTFFSSPRPLRFLPHILLVVSGLLPDPPLVAPGEKTECKRWPQRECEVQTDKMLLSITADLVLVPPSSKVSIFTVVERPSVLH